MTHIKHFSLSGKSKLSINIIHELLHWSTLNTFFIVGQRELRFYIIRCLLTHAEHVYAQWVKVSYVSMLYMDCYIDPQRTLFCSGWNVSIRSNNKYSVTGGTIIVRGHALCKIFHGKDSWLNLNERLVLNCLDGVGWGVTWGEGEAVSSCRLLQVYFISHHVYKNHRSNKGRFQFYHLHYYPFH